MTWIAPNRRIMRKAKNRRKASRPIIPTMSKWKYRKIPKMKRAARISMTSRIRRIIWMRRSVWRPRTCRLHSASRSLSEATRIASEFHWNTAHTENHAWKTVGFLLLRYDRESGLLRTGLILMSDTTLRKRLWNCFSRWIEKQSVSWRNVICWIRMMITSLTISISLPISWETVMSVNRGNWIMKSCSETGTM